jgi:hypothetical protein
MSAGQRPDSERFTTSFQSLIRNSMSDFSSFSETFSATVRTMNPEPGRAHRFDDVAQPAALAIRGDAPGDPDVVDRRHEHQVAPRQRDVARGPRALGADGLLRDLDDDLLTFLEEVLDARAAGGALAVGLFLVLVVRRLRGIPREQTASDHRACRARPTRAGTRLLGPDVDEGGLHSGQHALDAPLVDVSGDAAFALALDVQLAQQAVFDQRDPRLGAVGIDDEEARHSGSYQNLRAARGRADGNVRVHGRSFATEWLV